MSATERSESEGAVQRVVKVRRDYNSWVARETMEDYALRFTPRSFRKWSALRVANTAFGATSFLALEAMAVGTPIIVKPAPATPLSALVLLAAVLSGACAAPPPESVTSITPSSSSPASSR